jgi:hypothetical protein
MDYDDSSEGLHEAAPVITKDREPAAPMSAASIVPSFLAGLTRAMQAAAEQQREQIAAIVADEAAGEIEKAHARGAIEADKLRRLADEDIRGIETWLAEETERIRSEAGRRTEARWSELDSHLVKHHSIIATEVDGVELAVRDYRATLDAFFEELGEATDPAEIARQAGSLPAPPDLDAVRGAARANAVAKFAFAAQKATEAAAEPAAAVAVVDTSAESSSGPGPEPEIAAEDTPFEPAAAGGDGGEPSEKGVGVGVMDPAAVDQPADEAPAPASAPEPVVAGSVPPSSAAIRLFRTITDWAQPAGNEHDHDTRGS